MNEPRTTRPDDAASRIVLAYLVFGFVFVGGTEVLLRAFDATTPGWRIGSRLLYLAFSAIFLSLVVGRELKLRQQAERQVRQLYSAEHRARLGEEHARRHLTLHANAAEALAGDIDAASLARLGDVLVPEIADLAVLVRFEDGGDVVLARTAGDGIDGDGLQRLLDDPAWWELLRGASTPDAPHLIRDDDTGAVDPLIEPLVGLGVRSLALVPVRFDASSGLLLCGTTDPRRGLRPSDLEALAAVGDRITLAVQRAALQDASLAATERLAALVQHSPVGILELDPNGIVRAANPSALELLGGNGALAVHPDLLASLEEVRLRLAAGETVLGSELTTKRADGTELDVWLAASLLGTGTLLVVVADVTERRRLRSRFEQTQRLEALGQMAGAVAHDYNNLLTVILGYTELVEHQLGPDHPSVPDLQAVRAAGEQARTLADHLLTVSRRRVVSPEVLAVDDLLEGMLPLLTRLVGPAIEVSFTSSCGSARIIADRGQLESALLNLTVNARDAMPGGGELRVALGQAHLENGSAAVEIVFSDDGVGMDEVTVARCFEPFFTTKHRTDGTGLGLATVHAAITQAGGSVAVDSRPGRGTTFRILLPVTESPAPAQVVRGAPAGGHERILFVEDEAGIRAFGRDVLEANGYDVTLATDGLDAEQQVLGGLTFDLLLTDVVMPGLNGVALARRVEALRPGVPVVFVSGFAEDPALHRAGERALFLPKPFRPDDLLGAVRDALDRAPVQGSNR